MIPSQIYLFLSLALYPGAFSLLTGFDPKNLPYKSDGAAGQTGYNRCGTKATKDSQCQNLFINSAEDFCVFAPPTVLAVGEAERIAVSYCSKDGHGTRLIPPGTFKTLHYVRTPHYIQITAVGDFTKINVPAHDEGGELDPSGADGHGNPIGGLVFGERGQFNHWTEFIAHDELSIRACFNTDQAYRYCQHIYDLEGSRWNMPGNYDGPGFDQCEGDDVPHPMGEYRRPDGSIYTYKRSDGPTPPPGAPGKIKSCKSARAPGLNYPRTRR
ncbi:hypothetical protein PTTG_06434 [Puccinia triticina 1-1 BBBD Race 1]|uniref:Uncharacterized protein n=2 Tax=Puccinia triticina TaxID=208348 RepID=A0A0C4F018_PUCT1|nr:uncharacterized protein PtA15_6A844 [Puccinia triticina]OAV97043.1 hypothetical protein PTTG_06434 [Puccinia triticina 1-1 BBBD Race 1]WAQ86212.1 hypothetical protein PtA15_6A844 [Puccinia triticina]WAR56096.1 hypothetical protein PtB15_6B841 [Puccinia triticina]